MLVALGFHRNPEDVETPLITTALLAAGAIANIVTSAIAGISSFSRRTTALLACPIWRTYGRDLKPVQPLRNASAAGRKTLPLQPSRSDGRLTQPLSNADAAWTHSWLPERPRLHSWEGE